MPLDYLILPAPGVKVGLWNINENLEELLQMYNPEMEEETSIRNLMPTRQLHHLSSRILAKTFYPDSKILKTETGKPYLHNNNAFISWSHSGKYAAFICNEHESTGIDIELISPKVLRIEDKFCNKIDKTNIHKTRHMESLLLIWSAKESMYKWYGEKEVDFKLHMTVEAFDLREEGRFIARFHKPEKNAEFLMEYKIMNDHLAVWIHEEII
jgi:4'-phosphopantetheinyl transferase